MEAYFDNSATTRVFDSVRDIVVKTMTEDYGNPSAKHRKGMEAEQYVRQAAADIAKTLKVRDKEILFTSGGTESNNMALIGTAMANQRAGKHIISTRIEHASVYNPLAYLEQQGFEVTYLSVDSQGHISLEELEAAIRPDTILVSIMYVNNEVGAIEPVEQIASLIHGKNPAILFHVDAIQAYGKLTIRPKKQGIDLLSVSAHKIHGPKGVGFLYIDEKVKIRPLLYGGGQQKDMRSGTENVPGIAGMGRAAREIYTDHQQKVEYITGLKDYMTDRMASLPGVTVNSRKGMESAPQIVSASFQGVRSEVLLHALEDKGIYVSSGSACSSNHPAISGTLKAIGVRQELLDSTLRFSFGVFNTKKMQYQSFLIKYAEIGTKGKNRYMFEDALIKQIRYALKSVEGQFDVTKESGRIYVKAETDYDYDDAVEALKRVFGIADICPMVQIEDKDYENLKQHVVEYMDQVYPDKNITFKVNARRGDKQYPVTSEQINRDIHAAAVRRHRQPGGRLHDCQERREDRRSVFPCPALYQRTGKAEGGGPGKPGGQIRGPHQSPCGEFHGHPALYL